MLQLTQAVLIWLKTKQHKLFLNHIDHKIKLHLGFIWVCNYKKCDLKITIFKKYDLKKVIFKNIVKCLENHSLTFKIVS
jgi:hypothetical protein